MTHLMGFLAGYTATVDELYYSEYSLKHPTDMHGGIQFLFNKHDSVKVHVCEFNKRDLAFGMPQCRE